MDRDDVPAILAMARRAFRDIPRERLWEPAHLEAHLDRFPEGQWVAEIDGRVVASCTNMRTTMARVLRPHRWKEITGGGLLGTHVPDGDVLYGTEIMVDPSAQRRGIGTRLYRARLGYVAHHGLRAYATGGRLPGYRAHADRMTCREYVDAVVRGTLRDGVLTPDLKWGLAPRGILCDYLFDPPSLHHATLLVWENPGLG